MRNRPAPSAARTASSRFRAAARTSSRFATFAQAMSSTRLTAAIRIQSDDRTLPTTRSGNDRTPNDWFGVRTSGKRCRNVSAACCSPAVADSTLAPGASRPTARTKWPFIALFGSMRNGRYTSGAPSGPCSASVSKGPRTPSTVWASPPMGSVPPTMSAAPPKRRCQNPWPSTTTRPPFGRSSSAEKVRPATVVAPNSRKKSAVTDPATICSGSPPVRLAVLNRYAETSCKAPACSRHTLNLVGEAMGKERWGPVVCRTTSRLGSG